VYAQSETTATNTATTTMETIKTDEPKMDTVGDKVVKGLTKAKQTRIINLAANISNKLDAITVRFEMITDRIESRIIKMEAEGYDVSEAKNALSKTRSEIEEAKNSLASIDTLVSTMSSSEKPKAKWLEVRATFKTAHQSLKNAKEQLKETLTLLRQAVKIAPTAETSTSTESVTLEN
jgi:predicted  nucleic acid-binding Zn-ribbon protein